MNGGHAVEISYRSLFSSGASEAPLTLHVAQPSSFSCETRATKMVSFLSIHGLEMLPRA